LGTKGKRVHGLVLGISYKLRTKRRIPISRRKALWGRHKHRKSPKHAKLTGLLVLTIANMVDQKNYPNIAKPTNAIIHLISGLIAYPFFK